MKQIVKDLRQLQEINPNLCVPREKIGETLGFNPEELFDMYGITKSDLIRLERLGLAIKARYEVRHPKTELWDKLDEVAIKLKKPPVSRKNGTHRVRWILIQENTNEASS